MLFSPRSDSPVASGAAVPRCLPISTSQREMEQDPEGEPDEQERWNTEGWFQKRGWDIQGRLKTSSLKQENDKSEGSQAAAKRGGKGKAGGGHSRQWEVVRSISCSNLAQAMPLWGTNMSLKTSHNLQTPTASLLVAGSPAPWARHSKRPAGTSRSCPSPHLGGTFWSGATPAAHLPLWVTPQCLSHVFACPWGHPHLVHITLKSAGQAARCPFSAPRRSGPHIVQAAVVCTGPFPQYYATQPRSGCDPIRYTPQVLPLRTSCSFWIRLILAEASPFTGSLTEFHSNLSRSFGGILALLPVQLQSFPFLYYMGAE